MTARPDPFRTHVADQVLAALAEAAPAPMPTPAVQYETGYGARYGQLVYIVLTQLARAGKVAKASPPGVSPCYWRRLAPVINLPRMSVRSDLS